MRETNTNSERARSEEGKEYYLVPMLCVGMNGPALRSLHPHAEHGDE